MRNASRLWFALLLLFASGGARGEDVVLELPDGDAFHVEDDTQTSRMSVDSSGRTLVNPGPLGTEDLDNSVALAVMGGTTNGKTMHRIAACREDTGKCDVISKAGSGYMTAGSIIVDGGVLFQYDEATRKFVTAVTPLIDDPEGPGTLATMAQFGADVETAVIIRANDTVVNGRNAKILLGLDKQKDWVYKIRNDGGTCWGDPNQKGSSSFDVCLERVDEGGFEFARFQNDIDGTPVTVDIKRPVVQGSNVDSHGPLLWGDSSDDFDTGDEVCADAGLSCVTTQAFAGGSQTCGFDHGSTGTYFYALCK